MEDLPSRMMDFGASASSLAALKCLVSEQQMQIDCLRKLCNHIMQWTFALRKEHEHLYMELRKDHNVLCHALCVTGMISDRAMAEAKAHLQARNLTALMANSEVLGAMVPLLGQEAGTLLASTSRQCLKHFATAVAQASLDGPLEAVGSTSEGDMQQQSVPSSPVLQSGEPQQSVPPSPVLQSSELQQSVPSSPVSNFEGSPAPKDPRCPVDTREPRIARDDESLQDDSSLPDVAPELGSPRSAWAEGGCGDFPFEELPPPQSRLPSARSPRRSSAGSPRDELEEEELDPQSRPLSADSARRGSAGSEDGEPALEFLLPPSGLLDGGGPGRAHDVAKHFLELWNHKVPMRTIFQCLGLAPARRLRAVARTCGRCAQELLVSQAVLIALSRPAAPKLLQEEPPTSQSRAAAPKGRRREPWQERLHGRPKAAAAEAPPPERRARRARRGELQPGLLLPVPKPEFPHERSGTQAFVGRGESAPSACGFRRRQSIFVQRGPPWHDIVEGRLVRFDEAIRRWEVKTRSGELIEASPRRLLLARPNVSHRASHIVHMPQAERSFSSMSRFPHEMYEGASALDALLGESSDGEEFLGDGGYPGPLPAARRKGGDELPPDQDATDSAPSADRLRPARPKPPPKPPPMPEMFRPRHRALEFSPSALLAIGAAVAGVGPGGRSSRLLRFLGVASTRALEAVDRGIAEAVADRTQSLFVLGGAWSLLGCQRAGLRSVECLLPGGDRWQAEKEMKWQRFASSVAVVNGLIYICGGSDSHVSTRLCERFDPRARRWQELPQMILRRSWAMACALDGRFFVCGGVGQSDQVIAAAESFDPVEHTWQQEKSMSEPHYGSACVLVDGDFHIMGGHGKRGVLSGCERFDGQFWHPLPDLLEARWCCHATYLLGCVYVVGGNDGIKSFRSGEHLPLGAGKWKPMPPMEEARHSAALVTVPAEGKIYICGGHDKQRATSSVEVYDIAGNCWRSGPRMKLGHTQGVGQLMAGRIHVVAGHNESRALGVSESLDLTAECPVWEATSMVNRPQDAYEAAGVQRGRTGAVGALVATL